MVYLEVFSFFQHQEYDLVVHLNADTLTPTGLFFMLIYMGPAFS